MKHLYLALALVLMPACATVPTSPGDVANQTVLDEKLGIGIETAYAAAAEAATLAIRAGVVDAATAQRIAALDRQAYAAVRATRAAYDAGNASSYQASATQALPLLRDMLALIRGGNQ